VEALKSAFTKKRSMNKDKKEETVNQVFPPPATEDQPAVQRDPVEDPIIEEVPY
jgi:hypothetical protein